MDTNSIPTGRAGTGVVVLLLLPLLLLATLSGPAWAGDDEVVSGDLGKELDATVARASHGAFWGAVLVAKEGKILLAKGYGEADYESRPNTANTLFEIASVSKLFTAAAVLRLAMDGKLKLSDPIAKHLRGVPKDKREITIHHLLTHTSGLRQDAGVPYASKISRAEYIRHVLKDPLVTRPGEVFAYNNAAYALLAALVEEVSGTSFEKYSEQKLFGPAGMKDTGFIGDSDLDKTRQAARRGERMPNATAIDWFWGWGYRGMGGVVTTVHDLYLWDRALKGDRILDARTREIYYDPYREGYACGWRVERTERGTLKVHHSGGGHGFACQYSRLPEDDVVVAVLSNGKTNLFEIEKALLDVILPPPTITARLDVGAFEPDARQIATLPATLAWRVEKAGEGVEVHLDETSSGKTAVTLALPHGPAQKLAHDLTTALRDQTGGASGFEAGLYLQPYRLTGPQLEIVDGLSLMVKSRYVGRGEGGVRVVDERITLSVVDTIRHQWPVMVKMGADEARALLTGLEHALE